MKRTCKQCGKEFELSDSEISFYKNKGLELPKRCQTCRDQNKVRDSHTAQRATKVNSSMRDLPQGSRNNSSNGNHNSHKNSVIITAVAVLLLLVVFAVKNMLALPSEEAVPTADVASLEASLEMSQPEQQEFVQELLSDLVSGTFEEKQESTTWQSEAESETGQQTSDEEHAQTSQEQTEQTPAELQISAETAPEALQEASSVTYKFRKAQYLTEHFEKHAAEFSYTTEEEYLAGANRVIQNPEALHKLEAEDGDDVYFVESTNEFVVVSTDGYIRTYFKANIDYYNRQ